MCEYVYANSKSPWAKYFNFSQYGHHPLNLDPISAGNWDTIGIRLGFVACFPGIEQTQTDKVNDLSLVQCITFGAIWRLSGHSYTDTYSEVLQVQRHFVGSTRKLFIYLFINIKDKKEPYN